MTKIFESIGAEDLWLLTRDHQRTACEVDAGNPSPALRQLKEISGKPIAFWCLNHLLEEHELKRQIGEFKAGGFGGFFMHPRAGLLTPYGSAEWYRLIGECIREAKRLGLDAWLYDEDPYPSGMGGGFVTLGRPQLRASTLVPVIQEIKVSGKATLDLPPGELLGAYLVEGGKVFRIDHHAGLLRTDWKAIRLANHSYYPPFSAEGAPHWRAGTKGQHLRVTIEVAKAPAKLVAFVRSYITADPWGEYVDLLNPDSVDVFVELTHEAYRTKFGLEFGEAIPGIFTDEPKVMGAYPWSESLEPIYQELAGEEIKGILPHLVLDIDERSEWRRWAYRETISRAFKRSFIDKIASFCHETGLHFVGHISPEEDPIVQAVYTPGLMTWLGGMDIVGTDLIGSEIGDERHKLLHLGPKLASSVAHTRGKDLVLCEAFGVTDWVMDTAWMGRAINWLYVLGINLLTPHGQFYSIDGPRKREAPPSEFFQASYWEHMSAISAYVENLSTLLREGVHVAPIAIYYPAEAFMAWAPGASCFPILSDEAQRKSEALRELLAALIDLLLTSGYDFDLLDAEALQAACMDNGRLSLHQGRYELLLVPGGLMRVDSVCKLKGLEAEGLQTISLASEIAVLGGEPYIPPFVSALPVIIDRIRSKCHPHFQAEGRLIGQLRKTADGYTLFLINNGDCFFSGEVALGFSGPYEEVDLQTLQSAFLPQGFHLNLEPGCGVLIRGSNVSAIAPTLTSSRWTRVQNLSDGWTCRAESDNTLILQEFRVCGGDGSTLPDEGAFLSAPIVDLLAPSLEYFPWPDAPALYYWTTFECRGEWSSLALVRDSQLGPPTDNEFSDHFHFFVNQHRVEGFHRRRRYDPWNWEANVGPYLRNGRNSLIMEQSSTAGLGDRDKAPYDAIRLFGAFCVDFPHGRSTPACLTPRPDSFHVDQLKLVDQFGHAQYGGIFVYSRRVHLDVSFSRVALQFSEMHESIEVRVNGACGGYIWQPPYRIEIDPSLWRKGNNVLEIRCATSPANYLQGLRRPAGLCGNVYLEVCSI